MQVFRDHDNFGNDEYLTKTVFFVRKAKDNESFLIRRKREK